MNNETYTLDEFSVLLAFGNRLIRDYAAAQEVVNNADYLPEYIRDCIGESLGRSIVELYVKVTEINRSYGAHKVMLAPINLEDKHTLQSLQPYLERVRGTMLYVLEKGKESSIYSDISLSALAVEFCEAAAELFNALPDGGPNAWKYEWTVEPDIILVEEPKTGPLTMLWSYLKWRFMK